MDNVIQIGFAVGVIFVVTKWLFSGPSTPAPPRQPRVVPQGQVDAVLSAFPQITERQARWDLGRSGSVETTIERILREGRLPEPPPGLFPATDPTAAAHASENSTASAARAASMAHISSKPNLITRFNLQGRIEEADDIKGKGKATQQQQTQAQWAASTEDRQDSLKERKARLILDARRRLLEKDRAAM